MPNHVHLILLPSGEDALSRAIGETPRRYSGYVNARERVTGHLFQGRFGSAAMDQPHLLAAFRYVAVNPVKAGLVQSPEQSPWSSARAHIAGRDDALATLHPLLECALELAEFFANEADPQLEETLTKAQSVGRPLMSDDQLPRLDKRLNRRLRPARRRRPRKTSRDNRQTENNVIGKVSP